MVNPKESYNLHWPMSRGSLNVHAGLAGSMSAALQDLEDIWSTVLQAHLNIPQTDITVRLVLEALPDKLASFVIFNFTHFCNKLVVTLTLLCHKGELCPLFQHVADSGSFINISAVCPFVLCTLGLTILIVIIVLIIIIMKELIYVE